MAQIAEERRRLIAAIDDWHRRNAIQQCLAQDESCTAPVIRAHSVQGSYVIDRLARNGHVYMFRRGPDGFQLVLEGRNRATTFTGFCQSHDLELFREVDFDGARPFNPESKRQLGLLSLRAVAREYWTKLNVCKMYQRLLCLATAHDVEAVRQMFNVSSLHEETLTTAVQFLRQFLTGTIESTSRIQRLYRSLYTQIQRDRFHLMHSCVFSINGEATIAVASVFAPEFDLEGRQLNTFHYMETDPTVVVLTILPSDAGTHVLFTFHKRHAPKLEPFFNQMKALKEHELKQILGKMVVMHCENTVLAPRLVDALTTTEQLNKIKQIFSNTVFKALPYDQVPDVSLFETCG